MEGADHFLRFAVAGLRALAREAATERFGALIIELLHRGTEDLADVGVDAQDEGNRVEHNAHGTASDFAVVDLPVPGWRVSFAAGKSGPKDVVPGEMRQMSGGDE